MAEYKFNKIETKWQQYWQEQGTNKVEDDFNQPKCYVLDMFPYVSGAGLHVGHPKGYIATDVYSRFKRLNGFNVLHPMGWDAFGLPAENYALKNKVHPDISTKQNIIRFKEQLNKIGFDYDWDREINTTDAKYYKWTQWIFLQMYKKGLAYESHESINWCPQCKTGLANEDLEDANCKRCGSTVVQKPLRQWVLKIRKYADRLLDDLKLLDWEEEEIIEQQINWIGRKTGIDITYKIKDTDFSVTVFTTRPETNFGATFIVAAPDSRFVKNHLDKFPRKSEVNTYIETALQKTELDRIKDGRSKTGVDTGLVAINDLTKEEMPVYVADFVLPSFGTGVVVAVPGHDLHDFEFAKEFSLPIKRVIVGPDGDESIITKTEQVQEDAGIMISSEFLNGLKINEARAEIMAHMEKEGMGKQTVTYRLKDWVFSRQRYWGEPIPIIHCDRCGAVPVPEADLPVLLPDVQAYEPTDTGESPLANIDDWVQTTCPQCGGEGRRETNTMPQWAGSCWYYLRYLDPQNDQKLVDKDKEKYWMNVDMYVGGAEHATRHLLYARFWHKFLYDIGVVSTLEPFQRLYHVGLIMGSDSRKMSKRWGNVISPDDVIASHGADALRMYEMFIGPFSQSAAWNEQGMEGMLRFLKRIYTLYQDKTIIDEDIAEQQQAFNVMLNKVSSDIEEFAFNTAVSAMMIFINSLSSADKLSQTVLEKFTIVLAPFVPHLAEELWHQLGATESVFKSSWPVQDKNILEQMPVVYVVQINSKVRDQISAKPNLSEAEVKELALASDKVKKHLQDKDIKKIVFVPNKIINFLT